MSDTNYHKWCRLNQPCTMLKRPERRIARSYDLSIMDFHCTQEEEQDINYVLELINLANLDDKFEPGRHVTYRL